MSAVLVRRTWPGKYIYVSRENPMQTVELATEAYRFSTLKLARECKKALRLDRTFAARKLPEWFR